MVSTESDIKHGNQRNSIMTTTVNKTNIVDKIFTETYDKVSVLIPYSKEWENGTGYFDDAVNVPLEPGVFGKSETPEGKRRLLMCGTRFGTIVVFDRFSGPEHRVFVSNAPSSHLIDSLLPSGAIGERAMAVFTGGWDPENNIGNLIEDICNEVVKQ